MSRSTLMLEEAKDVLVSTLGKPGVRWKFAKKGTLFEKTPDIRKDRIHIFKDLTQIYCDSKNKKTKRKLGTIFWVKGREVQHKLTHKEEAIVVKRYYNDRGRESIDWTEAETLHNRLQDPETGAVYSFLPHSLWKKHLSGSKKCGDMTTHTQEKSMFSFDQDIKLIKKWGKHSVKQTFLTDRQTRREFLKRLEHMRKTQCGYDRLGEEDPPIEFNLRRFASVKKK